MLQRVGIAQSLLNNPKLLFYDEPTSGLDAIARRDIRDLILHLKGQGITMFLSSHQLEDVEMICDRVSIINRGVLQTVGRVEDLIAGGRVEIVVRGIRNGLAEKIRAAAPDTQVVDSTAVITQPDDNAAVARMVDIVRAGEGHIVSITPKRRTLEDIFVETVTDRSRAAGGATPMAPPSSEESDAANSDREVNAR
jgi:ABC-2 type transport system ATP-binding protein